MEKSRSNNILFIGVGVFAVGALLAFFGLKSQDKPVATPQSAPIAAATPGSPAVRSVTVGPAGAVATTFTIPKGKQAVQVDIPAIAGLGGYAKPGDLVNIYATVRNQQPNTRMKTPFVKLVLTNVKVLDVHAGTVGAGGSAVYLFALDTAEAEKVIFYAKYESMWLALAASDQKPETSAGRSYQNLL